MQKITALFIAGCYTLSFTATAQSNITKVEYFFNNDPGFGKANQITVNPDTDIRDFAASVPVGTLPTGLNTLFIRSANTSNTWSITNRFLFLKTNGAPAPNITSAEYFVDRDPGFGNANPIAVSADTIVADKLVPVSVSAESPGLHNLFIRSKDAAGRWSITNHFLFLKTGLKAPADVNAVEYFFDTDPGFGTAMQIAIRSGQDLTDIAEAINVTQLSPGLHTLFIRSRNADGKWSITNHFLFYETSDVLSNIVEAEYFIDVDKGFGNNTKVPQLASASNDDNVSLTVDITKLDTGQHRFFIRSKDLSGKWSITNYLLIQPGALPVKWLSFDALPLQNEVLLQWKTASEQNSSYFEIEFSENGITFSGIGKVAASGYSDYVSAYRFTHTSPVKNGNNYYRIRQFDKDGGSTYSPVRLVKFEATPAFAAWPNPVTDKLNIHTSERGVTIHIFESGGKNVFTQKMSDQNEVVNLSALASGIYYLVAEKNGVPLYTKNILKQ